jgi:hypothetical protein
MDIDRLSRNSHATVSYQLTIVDLHLKVPKHVIYSNLLNTTEQILSRGANNR